MTNIQGVKTGRFRCDIPNESAKPSRGEIEPGPVDPDKLPRIDWSRFEPSDAELANGMITKNACQCLVCGANADRFQNRFQCQVNPNHIGDLVVGRFSDLTHSA